MFEKNVGLNRVNTLLVFTLGGISIPSLIPIYFNSDYWEYTDESITSIKLDWQVPQGATA